MKTIFLLFCVCFAPTALAQTCAYGKVNDSIMIANVPLQSTKNRPQGACFGYAEPEQLKTVKSGKQNNITPVNFPKIDAATQKQRGGTRRLILKDELSTEQAALDQAQKSKKTDDVMLHQQNVDMLQKELTSLK